MRSSSELVRFINWSAAAISSTSSLSASLASTPDFWCSLYSEWDFAWCLLRDYFADHNRNQLPCHHSTMPPCHQPRPDQASQPASPDHPHTQTAPIPCRFLPRGASCFCRQYWLRIGASGLDPVLGDPLLAPRVTRIGHSSRICGAGVRKRWLQESGRHVSLEAQFGNFPRSFERMSEKGWAQESARQIHGGQIWQVAHPEAGSNQASQQSREQVTITHSS